MYVLCMYVYVFMCYVCMCYVRMYVLCMLVYAPDEDLHGRNVVLFQSTVLQRETPNITTHSNENQLRVCMYVLSRVHKRLECATTYTYR